MKQPATLGEIAQREFSEALERGVSETGAWQIAARRMYAMGASDAGTPVIFKEEEE